MTDSDTKQQPSSLTWGELISGGDLQSLALPEFGGRLVWLKQLPARPLIVFHEMPDGSDESLSAEVRAEQKQKKNDRQYELIAEALVDKDGKRLAPKGDLQSVLEIPMSAVMRMMKLIMGGIIDQGGAEEKDEAKND